MPRCERSGIGVMSGRRTKPSVVLSVLEFGSGHRRNPSELFLHGVPEHQANSYHLRLAVCVPMAIFPHARFNWVCVGLAVEVEF